MKGETSARNAKISAETPREVKGEKVLDKTLSCSKITGYHYVQVGPWAK